jgi:hypothetical protein
MRSAHFGRGCDIILAHGPEISCLLYPVSAFTIIQSLGTDAARAPEVSLREAEQNAEDSHNE